MSLDSRVFAALIVAFAAGLPAAVPARAETDTTLARVRKQGFVQCGSAERPGLAETDGQGRWSGLNVQVCRAIAVAALGPEAKFAFHKYESDRDYAAIRTGGDQVSFLTFGEMAEHTIADALVPGPTVFVETHDMMVADTSPVQHLRDMAGQVVCDYEGSRPDASLDGYAEKEKIEFPRLGFEEEGEMYDAFNVQRCKAVVGEATALAAARLDGGVNHIKSRLLPEHLKAFPIVAATPLQSDGQWAAIVAWSVHTLVVADTVDSHARVGGLPSMKVAGAGLGLAPDWQKTVIATTGSYGAIFQRTLGDHSLLRLERGLNAPLESDGVLTAPAGE